MKAKIEQLERELDAEKELADKLYLVLDNSPFPGHLWQIVGDAVAAYRKARGL